MTWMEAVSAHTLTVALSKCSSTAEPKVGPNALITYCLSAAGVASAADSAPAVTAALVALVAAALAALVAAGGASSGSCIGANAMHASPTPKPTRADVGSPSSSPPPPSHLWSTP